MALAQIQKLGSDRLQPPLFPSVFWAKAQLSAHFDLQLKLEAIQKVRLAKLKPMKIKIILSLMLLLASASVGFAQKNRPNPFQATFISSRVVHRVKVDNKWFMVVYASFKLKNALSNPCRMNAYFYNGADGKPLKAAKGSKYGSVGGFVTAGSDFTPAYVDANYPEFKIYIPYEELNLDSTPGNLFNLKYYLSMRDEAGNAEIAKSTWFNFSLKY